MTLAVPQDLPSRRPWLRAFLWIAGLGVLFYTSYPLANYLADQRAFVPSIVFGWEKGMPFLPWTIIPYWSINLFYAASLFFCATKTEVDTLGRRLLTAQLIAVTCFILFPLRFSFAKPEIGGGLPGFLFQALMSFDKPYNQAPSLHIALLVILWAHYISFIPAWVRWAWHLWCALIGVSVLTTYQHHFFDIPTGALLGLFCLWLWPDAPDGARVTPVQRAKRLKLAGFYTLGAVLLAILGIALGGWGLWLCYPAASLTLVAANYLWRGAAGFQKRPDGSMPLADRLLFAPYQLGAFLNSRWWTRTAPAPAEILPGLFLGRIPSWFDRPAASFGTIVDLCAELPARRGRGTVEAFPLLDLVAPAPAILAEAAKSIEAARASGTVLACCALGYSRSAAVVATWLLQSGRAGTVEEAIGIIRAVRPAIVLGPDARAAIAAVGKTGKADG
ncbi:ser/threonine protein phosphatase [Labrys miyagiensis]|uniref:Ser/threonine protein phosphatase n=1 Tax=Labrys miyagiensis TaxID=346912 RepID=A0ABQ6CR20_9HYPH|nr:phosphatase PAP2/dual specificity phosphatase family protein [Labrys miyagiensis]GLS22787.1 ser/threonine protein phosphatase [Labrys miyagiensis]